jgi:hypothetical protein
MCNVQYAGECDGGTDDLDKYMLLLRWEGWGLNAAVRG